MVALVMLKVGGYSTILCSINSIIIMSNWSVQSKQVMRPVKKRLMELNPEEEAGDSNGRYQRAVVEIGDHISSSLAQWPHSEERTQWKKWVALSHPSPSPLPTLLPLPLPSLPPSLPSFLYISLLFAGICGYLHPSSPVAVLTVCTGSIASVWQTPTESR